MFENVSEKVNQQLEGQCAFTAKPQASENNGRTSAPNTPVESTVANAEQNELNRLRKENAELKQKQLDVEHDQRLKAAVAASNVSDTGPSNGEQAIRRQRAIAAAKGLAHWCKIPIVERVNILTDGGYIQATEKEIGKFFGPNSSGADAQRLKASNSSAYRSYRAQAVELGLIG
jgi:hypothetical protein